MRETINSKLGKQLGFMDFQQLNMKRLTVSLYRGMVRFAEQSKSEDT